jgi:hypothetical protein
MRGMSGSKEEEVAGGMRKFLEEDLLRCVLLNIHRIIRLSEFGYVAHTTATRIYWQVHSRRFNGRKFEWSYYDGPDTGLTFSLLTSYIYDVPHR